MEQFDLLWGGSLCKLTCFPSGLPLRDSEMTMTGSLPSGSLQSCGKANKRQLQTRWQLSTVGTYSVRWSQTSWWQQAGVKRCTGLNGLNGEVVICQAQEPRYCIPGKGATMEL